MEEPINPEQILRKLQENPENEVVEFKKVENSGLHPETLGKYVSALSNEANIRGKVYAWLVYGIDNNTHKATGTNARYGANLKHVIAEQTTDNITIRDFFEIMQDGKRVVMIQIPAAPLATVVRWKRVAYGRDGESLVPLSAEKEEMIRSQTGLSDWSSIIEEDAVIEDLDMYAVSILKKKYAAKQNNPHFLTLPEEQILNDLELITQRGITRAAILLVGKTEAIRRYMPHATIRLEYRNNDANIEFNHRIIYDDCFYLVIDRLWNDINARNSNVPIHEGPYIFNIPAFNESVIREAVCNAIAHREYKFGSETLIKQYPHKITITNAGGFPLGVTRENLLTVPSTPRNRLLADVLSKTGVVERSGQGVDKIYHNTLSEGKDTPDYSNSTAYSVELTISSIIKDKAFAVFIKSVQDELPDEDKLSVFDIIALEHIRDDDYADVKRDIIHKLIKKGLVEQRGRTKGTKYHLSQRYYNFVEDSAGHFKKLKEWDESMGIPMIVAFLNKYGYAKMRDFESLFSGLRTRKQVKSIVQECVEKEILKKEGRTADTRYSITDIYKKMNEIMAKAFQLGLQEMRNRVDFSAPTFDRIGEDE